MSTATAVSTTTWASHLTRDSQTTWPRSQSRRPSPSQLGSGSRLSWWYKRTVRGVVPVSEASSEIRTPPACTVT
jgi:hypothetical protein